MNVKKIRKYSKIKILAINGYELKIKKELIDYPTLCKFLNSKELEYWIQDTHESCKFFIVKLYSNENNDFFKRFLHDTSK